MLRLYYAPGACSLAPHIVLRETGALFTLEEVDLRLHRLRDGTDYYTVTPKGQVPVLELADGTRISEAPVVLQYIADDMNATNLLQAMGTLARIRVLEWCNYITSEIHKSFGPVYNPFLDQQATDILRGVLKKKLGWVDEQLEGREYLSGNQFTIADAYLFAVVYWTNPIKLDISEFFNIRRFQERIAARPAVRDAMRSEGLVL